MKKKNKEKVVIIVLVVVIALLVLTGVILFIITRPDAGNQEDEPGIMGYDTSAVLADPATLQQLLDADRDKAEEGQMVLEMEVNAYSTDGIHFTCYLANALENSYDMYLILHEDDTKEELYRSNLIPLGGHIEEFEISKQLPRGNHTCTVSFVQMEEDHATQHAQVNVSLELSVR